MCTSKVSSPCRTGLPSADWSIPELSIATWPRGSHSSANTFAGGAAISRWTSNRSAVMLLILPRAAVVAARGCLSPGVSCGTAQQPRHDRGDHQPEHRGDTVVGQDAEPGVGGREEILEPEHDGVCPVLDEDGDAIGLIGVTDDQDDVYQEHDCEEQPTPLDDPGGQAHDLGTHLRRARPTPLARVLRGAFARFVTCRHGR